ncbi:MAG TPA: DNA polymerase IV [Acholeplasmataceae bacterium]|nr:DNA polymerase IV [Acholeplasmataceae bacterium]
MIKEPFLKKEVFVVGGRTGSNSGVVSTASYKARAKGIRSGMSIVEAQRLYPKVLVVPTNFPLYQKYSNLFFNYLKKYSKIILKGSIDEAYMDVTEISKEIHPLKLAKQIQDGLLKEHELPVSIGIGPTLFLAKMASDMKKPLGITVLRKRDVEKMLYPLPIGKIFGIGVKTKKVLNDIGIFTVNEFVDPNNKNKILEVMTPNSYYGFLDNINGKSTDIVDPTLYDIPKSISNEETLVYPIQGYELIYDHLKELAKTTVERLKNEDLVARTVSIKLKTSNFQTITRSRSISEPIEDFDLILQIANDILLSNYEGEEIRLVGIGLSQLILKKDLKNEINLFNYNEFEDKEYNLDKLIKKINKEYEKEVISFGIKED